MKPLIDDTHFGEITINGQFYAHDVIIRLNGKIEKRKKKLSKEIYGTSHLISIAEAKHIFEEGAKELIIGTGQTGYVKLSEEAADFFRQNKCEVRLFPTPKAVKEWNSDLGAAVGFFHITC